MAYTGPICHGVDYNPTWPGWSQEGHDARQQLLLRLGVPGYPGRLQAVHLHHYRSVYALTPTPGLDGKDTLAHAWTHHFGATHPGTDPLPGGDAALLVY